MKIVYVAAAALFNEQNEVLLAQRPAGKSMAGLWEFPGGKIEAGETPELALARELEEEISIKVDTTSMQPLTFASHTYETFYLFMPLYEIRSWYGEPKPCEGQSLAWVNLQTLQDYPAPAADIPLFAFLASHMKG